MSFIVTRTYCYNHYDGEALTLYFNAAKPLQITLAIVGSVLILMVTGAVAIIALKISHLVRHKKRMKNVFNELQRIHDQQSKSNTSIKKPYIVLLLLEFSSTV